MKRFAPIAASVFGALAFAAASLPSVGSGVIVVERENLRQDARTGIIAVDLPPYDAENDPNFSRAPAVGLDGDVGDSLLGWLRRGEAAGNRGDLYDNRDRDHSSLRAERFPQLTFVEYSDDLKKANVDYGVNPGLLFNRVTIGNSSTANTGAMWRSNPRRCYTEGQLVRVMLLQYASNQIYVYPEHRDHDPGHNGPRDGYGDVFPTNTPYLLISQGSSGSDRVFLEALACTLAALRPEVKAELTKRRMIAPVMQMILRRSYGDVRTREDYLSGIAHPTVFNGEKLDLRRMVDMAHGLEVADVPPLARLSVVEENLGTPGVDYFEPGPMERMLDSPFVVARIHRSAQRTMQMVVSADKFPPAMEGDVKFEWSLLRGDPQRVKITPLAEDGSRVRITVDYHPRMPIAPGSPLESNRVDIGCFADNGKLLSAPSFVTIHTLDSEDRTYDEDGRIVEINYGASSSEVGVKDWAKFARWIVDTDPAELSWLTGHWNDRERAAVRDAAAAYLALVDDAMKNPDNPTRDRLLKNADTSLDQDNPILGGSLRLAVDQAIQRFVHDPKAINRLHAASPTLVNQLAEANPRDKWVTRLEGAIKRGLLKEPGNGSDAWVIASCEAWPDGKRDRITGAETYHLSTIYMGLLQRLAPGGAIDVSTRANYVDPVLSTGCNWRDVYLYAPGTHEPIGWLRYPGNPEPQRFTAQGWRVTESDAKGRPTVAVEVTYKREGNPPKTKLLTEDTGVTHRFEYASDDDRVGRVVE